VWALTTTVLVLPPAAAQQDGHFCVQQRLQSALGTEIEEGMQNYKAEVQLHGEEPTELEKDALRQTASQLRKWLYREYVALQYGKLGNKVRVRLPNCVLRVVRGWFPDPYCNCPDHALCTSHYMGHKDS
jgi:hypothetical protein